MKKLTKKEISWILYDAGNSAYSMAITTALFPVYFGMFRAGQATMDLGYFNSLASILIAILAPILGTIADYKDQKKRFFLFFFLLGIITTAGLALVPFGQWPILVIVYILTSLGFAGANIFYDAFLVDVTSNERMDTISANGYAWGYIASVIPFGISLGVIYFIGLDNLLGYQLGFAITAIWWGLFTIPMLKNVHQVYYVDPQPNPVRTSFARLGKTLKEIRKYPVIFTFLLAYFLYIDGVDTIIKMVVPYAKDVLGTELDMMLLLGFLLVIQIVAFPFALLYGRLATRFGTMKMIRVAIITYIVAVFYSYFLSSFRDIFILGFFIASAQGGIQALSRSYYARIIPKENSNEFFGFYNIFGKFAAILGPFIMAFIQDVTGQARFSILGILPLFILGFLLTLKLPSSNQLNE